jgi:hypothetical protein
VSPLLQAIGVLWCAAFALVAVGHFHAGLFCAVAAIATTLFEAMGTEDLGR